MICSLCLTEILDNEERIVVDGRTRHKSCSDEFDTIVGELGKIYEQDVE